MILRPYQKSALRGLDAVRTGLLLWRRQAGKTTLFAWLCLKNMLRHPGCLNTFVSASISVGGEVLEREALLFSDMINQLKADAKQGGMDLATNADSLIWDDYLDLFSKSRLEIRLHHSPTLASRTKVIAPNIATARGYTGFVFMDEIGFIRDFRGLYEAVEPIFSSDPAFKLVMATTPPADDAHFSYEIACPDPGQTFPESPRGNWYTSQTGLLVHRLDIHDAHLAGVHLYDNDGNPVSPRDHRAAALDRDAWDRNYALKFTIGGTAACSLLAIQHAQRQGESLQCIAAENDLPPDWASRIPHGGSISIGLDPATTDKEKSNPSGLAVLHEYAPRKYAARLILRFKTADDRLSKAILAETVHQLMLAGHTPRRIVLDATSERYFAAQVKREFTRYCPVQLVVSSEKLRHNGQDMLYKQYTGNLVIDALEDNALAIPPQRWVKEDFRLVKRLKGTFDNETDTAGNHGDTFDATKLALLGLVSTTGAFEGVPVLADQTRQYRPHPFDRNPHPYTVPA